MKKLAAAALAAALWAGAGQAADFRPGGDATMDCLMTMSGTIQPGDADRFHQALTSVMRNPPHVLNGKTVNSIVNDGTPASLCLDSPGGSISEALKMADILYNYDALHGPSQDGYWIGHLGTAVPAGARCESACALLFLAGGVNYEGDAGRLPMRVLHARAKLGFHSVSLQVADGNYDAATVNQAFKVALASMEELTARQAILRLRPSLLSVILTTPSDSMHYVSTVGEAAEWNIEIRGLPKLKDPTRKNIAMACNHIQRRHASQDGSTFAGHMARDPATGRWFEEFSQIGDLDWAFERFTATEDGYEFYSPEPMGEGELCGGQYSTATMDGVVSTEETLGWASGFENHMLFPGDVTFSELLASGGADSVMAPDAVIRDRSTASDSRCMVFADGKQLDNDPCRLERRAVLTAGLDRDGEVLRFTWPSGAVTVVEHSNLSLPYGEEFRINGGEAYRDYPRNFGLDPAGHTCIVNSQTERVFCFLE